MPVSDKMIQTGYDYAKALYAEYGVDVDAAMAKAANLPVSMHCWQSDDVVGCEGEGAGATDGLATTGNYPGRARNADEVRQDADIAMKMIPGEKKFNLHASYAEKHGKKVDRDAYTIAEFQGWVDWAKDKNVGLDFNPNRMPTVICIAVTYAAAPCIFLMSSLSWATATMTLTCQSTPSSTAARSRST